MADPLGVGVGDGPGASLGSPPGEPPDVGAVLCAVPPPASGVCPRDGVPEGAGTSPVAAGEVEGDSVVEGESAGAEDEPRSRR